ncbi:MAG TPA: CHAD domain-containing protein [Acidimicrobiales bacterium]|nr:CHAD domain-containing protein [Acidimicrobiales bacterium]
MGSWHAASAAARARLDAALRRLATGAAPASEASAAALLRRLDHERGAALTSFVTARESSRAGAVEKHLEELCAAPPVTGRAERPVHELVPKLRERPWQDLRAAAKRARGAADGSELHAMRIRAKQLRYSAELAAPLLGPGLQRLARACAALQGRIGDHRDLARGAGGLHLRESSAPSLEGSYGPLPRLSRAPLERPLARRELRPCSSPVRPACRHPTATRLSTSLSYSLSGSISPHETIQS